MSRTKIHIQLAKYHCGLLEEIPTKLMNKFNRHNYEWGEFRADRKTKKELQAKKEMNFQLTEYQNE